MAQGYQFNKDEILQSLKPYFLLGMSITKACETLGNIQDQTILNWINDDPSIGVKIKAWQNYLSAKAREVWAARIQEGKDYTAAKEWLERKEKSEFSGRTELTGADGQNFSVNVVNYATDNDPK